MELNFSGAIVFAAEILLRLILEFIIIVLMKQQPFVRYIQTDDWHNYFYPYDHTSGRAKHFNPMMLGAYLIMIFLLITRSAITVYRYWRKNSCPSTDSKPLVKSNHLKKSSILGIFLRPQLALFWGITLTFLTTSAITEMIKVFAGRPRPDFIHRCIPQHFDFTDPNFEVLGAYPICTNPNKRAVLKGYKSFPSGHSALSMSIGVFGVLFVTKALNPMHIPKSVKFFLSLLFLAPWIYIPMSRSMDYRHHWEDIIFGGLIGLVVSVISFDIYKKGICDEEDIQKAASKKNNDLEEQSESLEIY